MRTEKTLIIIPTFNEIENISKQKIKLKIFQTRVHENGKLQ